MNKLYLFAYTILFSVSSLAQSTHSTNLTKPDLLTLKELRYDFGKIPQGKPVTHEFELINTGNEALAIENVQASCGCTTPEWTKDAIPAGGVKKIKVGYNAALAGKFEKAITVFYGGGLTKQFFIKGEVWQAPTEPAPANESIQLIKNTNR